MGDSQKHMQDYIHKAVRASLILTTAYVAGTVIEDAHGLNQLIILARWTKGSLTSLELKVEFSHDGTNWYQETFTSISGGTSTIVFGEYTTTTAGNYRIPVEIKDRFIRISGKGTGTVTGSLLVLDAVVGIS